MMEAMQQFLQGISGKDCSYLEICNSVPGVPEMYFCNCGGFKRAIPPERYKTHCSTQERASCPELERRISSSEAEGVKKGLIQIPGPSP